MVASFLGGFIIAFLKGWLLTFAMLLCIPPLVISGAVMTMLVSKMASHGQTAYSLAATVVEQTVGSIRTVSSFTGEKQAIAKYTKSLTKAYKSGVQEELAAGLGFGGDVISVIFAVLSGSLQLGQASPCITAFAAGQAAAFKRKYICMLTSAGFWSAMASNVTNQSRNVLSKKFMVKKEESLDNITLFSIITIMSFMLLAPVTFFTEGVKVTPAFMQSAGLNVQQVYTRSFLAALCFHAYQQVSYMILQRVSPVTHSVGNCVKRVVVIVTSVLFFRSTVTPVNAIGTGVALAGVFLYSRVKSIKPKTA